MVIIRHQRHTSDKQQQARYREIGKLELATLDIKASINLIRSALFKFDRDDAMQLIDMGRKFLIRALTKINKTSARNFRRLIDLADQVNNDIHILYKCNEGIDSVIVFTVVDLVALKNFLSITCDNLKKLNCSNNRINYYKHRKEE